MDIYSGGGCPKCGGGLKDVFIAIEYEEAIERVCINCQYTFDQRPLDWVNIEEKKIISIGEIHGQAKAAMQVLQGTSGQVVSGGEEVCTEEVYVPGI